ncbi:MAG: hypothetical protein AUK33_06125 [Flavobacteriaceae bacterium CG2_30_34_30]|nr:MAG: hypothetical protein AUK33_06125 [Flavobacteriaceae bacterium CG2_30_34_30]
MKNSKKSFGQKNRFFTSLNKILFITLTYIFMQVSSMNAQVNLNSGGVAAQTPQITLPIGTNPVFAELYNRIKNGGECFDAKVSSVSTKNNNYAFVSFAYGFIEKDGYNLKTILYQTEFDDRNNFQGAKTKEEIAIINTGSNAIGVNVKMITWGNRTLRLTNVNITKESYGYFITGKITDGNRTVYYTIGIYKTTCLI